MCLIIKMFLFKCWYETRFNEIYFVFVCPFTILHLQGKVQNCFDLWLSHNIRNCLQCFECHHWTLERWGIGRRATTSCGWLLEGEDSVASQKPIYNPNHNKEAGRADVSVTKKIISVAGGEMTVTLMTPCRYNNNNERCITQRERSKLYKKRQQALSSWFSLFLCDPCLGVFAKKGHVMLYTVLYFIGYLIFVTVS